MKSREQLKELRSKENKELLKELKDSYQELRKLRFRAKMRELKDLVRVKKTKKKISRTLTLLREKVVKETNEKNTSGKNN